MSEIKDVWILPVDLSLGVSSGTDGRDLLDAGHVLPAAVLKGLPQVVQANLRNCTKTKWGLVSNKLSWIPIFYNIQNLTCFSNKDECKEEQTQKNSLRAKVTKLNVEQI